jgi:hypothetical protein
MRLDIRIPENAEVMSSIGVALAMVRDVVERVVVNATPEDIAAIKQEARQAVMKARANPESIEVFVEVNPQTSRVRATAIGSMEMRAQDMMTAPDAEECRKIAATSMNLPVEKVELVAGSTLCTVYQGLVEERKFRFFKTTRRPIRVLDRQGFVKVQRSDGSAYQYTGADAAEGLKQSWEQLTIYNGDSIIFPDLFMIVGSHIMDLSGVQSVEHALGLVGTDLAGVKADEPIVVVGTRGARGLSG